VEGLLDLLEEVVGAQAKSQQRETQHGVPGDGQRVVSQGIADDVLGPRVMGAVDLDDQLPLGQWRSK